MKAFRLFFLLSVIALTIAMYSAADVQEDLTIISTTENLDTLKTYLVSKSEEIRIAAVTRLGEIGGSKVIPILVNAYNKEEYVTGKDVMPGVKEAVLRALGKTGLEEGRSAILDFLAKHEAAGPQIEEGFEREYYHIYEQRYFHIFAAGIESLAENFPDQQTADYLNELSQKENLHWQIIQAALLEKYWLLIQLAGIESTEDKVKNILDMKTGDGVLSGELWVKGGRGQKSPSAIIDDALDDVLRLKIGVEATIYAAKYFESLPTNDFRRRTAVVKTLQLLLYDIYRQQDGLNISPEHLQALETVFDYWEKLSKDELAMLIGSLKKPLKEIQYFNKDEKIGKRLEKILK